jgi:hypothetical protein
MTRLALVFALWTAAVAALAIVGDWRVAGAVWLALKLAGVAVLFPPLPRRLRRGNQPI